MANGRGDKASEREGHECNERAHLRSGGEDRDKEKPVKGAKRKERRTFWTRFLVSKLAERISEELEMDLFF